MTNNLALNEKAAAYARRGDMRVDVLACGSSMTLNNLSSKAVVEHFGTDDYFNLGAWGLDMEQVASLVEAAVPDARPKTVLVMANLMDLGSDQERSVVDMGRVIDHVRRGIDVWSYLNCPALVYYLRQMELNRLRFTDRANYECLMMDEYGGVALDVPIERVLAERWERPAPSDDALDPEQYEALRRLAAFLRTRGIQFVFIQSPYREGMASPELERTMAEHKGRVRSLLEAEGQVFIDGADRRWPDALFCDSSHLNGEAAYAFTQYVLNKMPVKGPSLAGSR